MTHTQFLLLPHTCLPRILYPTCIQLMTHMQSPLQLLIELDLMALCLPVCAPPVCLPGFALVNGKTCGACPVGSFAAEDGDLTRTCEGCGAGFSTSASKATTCNRECGSVYITPTSWLQLWLDCARPIHVLQAFCPHPILQLH